MACAKHIVRNAKAARTQKAKRPLLLRAAKAGRALKKAILPQKWKQMTPEKRGQWAADAALATGLNGLGIYGMYRTYKMLKGMGARVHGDGGIPF